MTNRLREVEGTENTKYIATLINPVDHRLYDVLFRPRWGTMITNPRPNVFYESPDNKIYIMGRGGVDRYDEKEIEGETYYRSHSPSGVAQKKKGLGFTLYSGMSLVAVYHTAAGIFSVQGDRSYDAERFWQAQVQRGYAEEASDYFQDEFETEVRIDEDMIDLCEVDCDASHLSHYPDIVSVTVDYERGQEIEYLPAVNVADNGLVLAWNEEDDELNALEYEEPPPDVLIGLDLSTTMDPALLINIVERLENEESIGTDQLQRFINRFPGPLQGADSQTIRELLGQQRLDFGEVEVAVEQELVANPRVKSDKAWKEYFGDLAKPVDES